MKQFLLGMLVCFCFGATAIKSDVLTVKPAKPISIIVINTDKVNIKDEIYAKIKAGTEYNVIVVMEKY